MNKESSFKKIKGEKRSFDEIYHHYSIEKQLAGRLINANRQERLKLYQLVYDELFRLVPTHPQVIQKLCSNGEIDRRIKLNLILIRKFVDKNSIYLEIGPGDCTLAYEVCKFVKQVYAIDVSKEISANTSYPHNFSLIISNGLEIPIENTPVNLAFSDQLMEHLHPDDAMEQLNNIFLALRKGGRYICITPNSLNGPHDISKYFDDVSTCFHLKEYTVSELSKIFKKVGFTKINIFFRFKKLFIKLPIRPVIFLEKILKYFPVKLRHKIMNVYPFRAIFEFQITGVK
jgi:SAM-dependent methyltransferase